MPYDPEKRYDADKEARIDHNRDMARWLVAFVNLGTLFIAYVAHAHVIKPWLGPTASGMAASMFLWTCAVMVLISYRRACTMHPGHVPIDYDIDNSRFPIVERKRNGEHRYCFACNMPKPPRAHHCSECRRCVLRMDHHCPWVNNCVGFRNHKAFLVFLFWTALGCGFAVLLTLGSIAHAVSMQRGKRAPMPPEDVILSAVMFCIAMPGSLGTASLLGYQMSCLLAGITTIEDWTQTPELRRALRASGRSGQRMPYMYDHGAWENFVAVFGTTMALWLWPTAVEGDGVSFEPTHLADGTPIRDATPEQLDPRTRRANRNELEEGAPGVELGALPTTAAAAATDIAAAATASNADDVFPVDDPNDIEYEPVELEATSRLLP